MVARGVRRERYGAPFGATVQRAERRIGRASSRKHRYGRAGTRHPAGDAGWCGILRSGAASSAEECSASGSTHSACRSRAARTPSARSRSVPVLRRRLHEAEAGPLAMASAVTVVRSTRSLTSRSISPGFGFRAVAHGHRGLDVEARVEHRQPAEPSARATSPLTRTAPTPAPSPTTRKAGRIASSGAKKSTTTDGPVEAGLCPRSSPIRAVAADRAPSTCCCHRCVRGAARPRPVGPHPQRVHRGRSVRGRH